MSVILVDTSTYLKLSRGLHPILGRPVGVPPRSCVVLSELDREFEAKPSLSGTFYWVQDPSWQENRKANLLSAMSVGLQEVRQWHGQVSSWVGCNRKQYRALNLTPPSPADSLIVAYGIAVTENDNTRSAIVSDDAGLRYTVSQFDYSDALSGWELLRFFKEAGLVDAQGIKQIYQYLDYLKELPPDWRVNSQTAFGFAS